MCFMSSFNSNYDSKAVQNYSSVVFSKGPWEVVVFLSYPLVLAKHIKLWCYVHCFQLIF